MESKEDILLLKAIKQVIPTGGKWILISSSKRGISFKRHQDMDHYEILGLLEVVGTIIKTAIARKGIASEEDVEK